MASPSVPKAPGESPQDLRLPHPWRVTVIAGMASFVDGVALSANGVALVIYQQSIGLTAGDLGVLTSVAALATAVGALFGGRFGDLYGRRRVFIITMLMVIVGSLGATFAMNFWVLLAGVTVVGLAVGADLPVSLATIAEASPPQKRGAMLVFTQVLWITGSLAVVILSSQVGGLGQLGGQLLYGFIAVVGTIGLLLRFSLPESPLWLRSRSASQDGGAGTIAAQSSLRDLMRTPLRRPLIVLTLFYALVGIPAGMLASYITFIAVNVAKIPVQEFIGWTAIAFPIGFLSLFAFMKIVGTRFRLTVVFGCGLLTAVALMVPVVFGLSLGTLIAIYALIGGIGAICGEPITRVWSNESFPTMLRSTAQGFVLTVGRLVLAVVLIVGPTLISLSLNLFLIVLAIVQLLAIAIAWFGFRNGRISNQIDQEAEHLLSSGDMSARAAS